MSPTQRRKAGLQDAVKRVRSDNRDTVQPVLDELREQLSATQTDLRAAQDNAAESISEGEQLSQELSSLQSDIQAANVALAALRTDAERLAADPGRIGSQAANVTAAVKEVEAEAELLLEKIGEVSSAALSSAARREEAEELRRNLEAKLGRHRGAADERAGDVAELERSLAAERAEGRDLMERKAALAAAEKSARNALRAAKTSASAATGTYDKARSELRRARNAAANAASAIAPLQGNVGAAEAELVSLQRESRDLAAQRLTAKSEVDAGVSTVLAAEGAETKLVHTLQATLDAVAAAEAERDRWRAEETQAKAACAAAAGARDSASRALAKLQADERATKGESALQTLTVNDATRRAAAGSSALRRFRKLYELVKGERNGLVAALGAASQALAEMKERLTRLHGEVDILAGESAAKDRALAAERTQAAEEAAARDSLRAEVNKAAAVYRDRASAVEAALVRIDRLNSVVSALERGMTELKARYERAVEARNAAGLALIDRNDEAVLLHERLNLAEEASARGSGALAELQERKRRLQSHAADAKRRLDAARSKAPKLPEVAEKLIALQRDLATERERVEQLCLEVEAPSQSAGAANEAEAAEATAPGEDKPNLRWVALGGEDPNTDRLTENVALLETRLSRARESVLEKALVLEELHGLLGKLRAQAEEAKGRTVLRVGDVANLSGRRAATERALKAAVAELSLLQAACIKLTATRDQLAARAAAARERLDAGEVPSVEAEAALRAADGRSATLQRLAASKRLAAGAAAEGTEVASTAPQRPNAYVDPDLGLPKPYMASARPMMPSAPPVRLQVMQTNAMARGTDAQGRPKAAAVKL